jgi:hypothetical protein
LIVPFLSLIINTVLPLHYKLTLDLWHNQN